MTRIYKGVIKIKIVLYKNRADNRKLNKSSKLSKIKTLDAHLKDDTSIIEPTLVCSLLSHAKLRECNYLYIPDFDRYYFINNIIEKTGRVFEIACHIDVLQTYKDDIKAITALILRQENVYHPYIEDGELLVRNDRYFEKKNIGRVGNGADNYYLTVNNGGE